MRMRKFVFIIFCFLVAISLFGCASQTTSENSNSFFGNWVVEKQLDNSPMGDFGNMDVKDIIGKELSFSKKKASCFGNNVDTLGQFVNNPEYIKDTVEKSHFEESVGITFSALGISGKNIAYITVIKDPSENTGIVFYDVDKNTLIVNGAGTFFLLKRK